MPKKTKILQPLGLAILLSIGIAIIMVICVQWCVTLMQPQARNEDFYEGITVYGDGPVITRQSIHSMEETELTLDRKELKKPKSGHRPQSFPVALAGTHTLDSVSMPLNAQLRVASLSDLNDSTNPNYWYFMHDGQREGKGYFVGFNSKSKNCIGYIGLRGLSEQLPKEEDWFPVDGRLMVNYKINIPGLNPARHDPYEPSLYRTSSLYSSSRPVLISDYHLLQIDLASGAAEPLFKSPDIISVYMMPVYRKYRHEEGDGIWIRTADRVVQFDTKMMQFEFFMLPEDLREVDITFYYLGKDKAIIDHKKWLDMAFANELTWIDSAGKILQRKDVQLTGQGSSSAPKNYRWITAIGMPSPLVMLFESMASTYDYLQKSSMNGNANSAKITKTILRELDLPLLAVALVAVILSILCYRRQRRYGLPWTWVWVGFVFIAGLPGYFGYRFHRRWAVLDGCPQCKKNVPRDRESCAACGMSFPLPERKGIEVFA